VTIAAAIVAVASRGDWAGVVFVAVVTALMCVVVERVLRRLGAVTRSADDEDPTVGARRIRRADRDR
jgi:hypothetical protein